MLAGIVPVAVNTLLTAEDLAYMLEHSRAQVALVSGAVKPALKAALAKADHEVHTVVVSRPTQPLDFGEIAFEDFCRQRGAADEARAHACRRSRFLALFVGSTGRPKGTVHSHANPYWTTELYGKAILGLKRERRLLLRRQALLRLRARQRADLSACRRRDSAAHGRTAHA